MTSTCQGVFGFWEERQRGWLIAGPTHRRGFLASSGFADGEGHLQGICQTPLPDASARLSIQRGRRDAGTDSLNISGGR